MLKRKLLWICAAMGLALVLGVGWLASGTRNRGSGDTYDVEREEIKPAPQKYQLFSDDNPAAKNPPFDPQLVDSRPVSDSPDNRWEINASAATICLDVPDLMGKYDAALQELYPSYAEAARALREKGCRILPSINQLDGKAKQFDDGLYAALDAGLTALKLKTYADTSALVRSLLEASPSAGPAHAWLWGALKVGGFLTAEESKQEPPGARRYIADFDADPIQSKPIGFYTWSEDLKRTFRFLRYLMQGWTDRAGVPDEIAAALAAKAELLKQYERILAFYARLTNPYSQLSFLPLTDPANAGKSVSALWDAAGLERHPVPTVHFLPYSGSKETRLFNRLFGVAGLPTGADLMLELVKAIRSGKVDLKPGAQSGWYDFQVYALETFLLPERGAESEKLILTKKYKERMLQAFAALITKRRETHVRQLAKAECKSAEARPPSTPVAPRLRVEPNPTFFLRTARAYAFLEDFLVATLPAEALKGLQGRCEGGERSRPLTEELTWMRKLFYGLHLVSCEDIGMRPGILADEPVDAAACTKLAGDWLAKCEDDPDLAADTRVSVPIFADYVNGKTRLWATLGVRGAKLQARYYKGPKWRPAKAEGETQEWQDVPSWQLAPAHYVILVDEFAEIELEGMRVLTREELRKVCDREGTKEAVLKALK